MPRQALALLFLPVSLALAATAVADELPASPHQPPTAPAPPAAAPPAAPAYAPPAYAPPAYAPPGYAPPGYAPPAPWPPAQAYPPLVPYAPPAPYPVPTTMFRSTAALGVGIVLLCLGTLTAAFTAPFLHTGPQTCAFDGAGYECKTAGIDSGLIAVTAISAAGALAGIPLIVYGAGRVPASGANGEGAGVPPSRWAGAPGANGWRWTF